MISAYPHSPSKDEQVQQLAQEQKAHWEREQHYFDKITGHGFQQYVERYVRNLTSCFTPLTDKERLIVCNDPRLAYIRGIHIGNIGNILQNPYASAAFAAILRSKGIQGIASHEDCRADGTSDSQLHAMRLATVLQAPYRGHRRVEQGFVPGRVIYVTDIEAFHLSPESTGMPSGFVVSSPSILDESFNPFISEEIAQCIQTVAQENAATLSHTTPSFAIIVTRMGEQSGTHRLGKLIQDAHQIYGQRNGISEFNPKTNAHFLDIYYAQE